ncbi:CHAT domain-containing protein [Coniochaeta sp. 2T2.1]|nr:CHAT domain-containing protein [Coniochaeta sp. 2T2.1]
MASMDFSRFRVGNAQQGQTLRLRFDPDRRAMGLKYYTSCSAPDDGSDVWDLSELDHDDLELLASELADQTEGNGSSRFKMVSHIHFLLFEKDRTQVPCLARAIVFKQKELDAVAGDDMATKGVALTDLVSMMIMKYLETGNIEDLDVAIIRAEEMMSITPRLHPDRSERNEDLIKMKSTRIGVLIQDLKEQIEGQGWEEPAYDLDGDLAHTMNELRDALDAMPAKHPKRPQIADELVFATIANYGRNPDLSRDTTIENLMAARRAIMDGAGSGQPRKVHLTSLGACLIDKVKRTPNPSPEDVANAREVLKQALTAPATSPTSYSSESPFVQAAAVLETLFPYDRVQNLARLGSVIRRSWEDDRKPKDLEEAVEVLEEMWETASTKGDYILEMGEVLVVCLNDLYNASYGPARDEGGIQLVNRALVVTNELLQHLDKPWAARNSFRLKSRWCNCMLNLWEASQDPKILEDAIDGIETIARALPKDYDQGPVIFGNLQYLYRSRFVRLLDPGDLDLALKAGKEGLRRAEGLEDREMTAIASIKFASTLQMAYAWNRDKNILDEAIKCSDRAVRMTDEQSVNLPEHASMYASLLLERYERTKHESPSSSTKDFNTAFEMTEGLLARRDTLQPQSLVHVLSEMAELYVERYARDPHRYPLDLDHAIEMSRDAFRRTPKNHVNWARSATSHARELGKIYDLSGRQRPEILGEAVQRARDAIAHRELVTPDSPALYLLRYMIAYLLVKGWDGGRNAPHEQVEESMSILFDCVLNGKHDNLNSVQAAMALCQGPFLSHEGMDWKKLAQATEIAVRLLPKVSSRALGRGDQAYSLGKLSGLAPMAAAAALIAGNGASRALELLEFGRGVMASFLLDTREDSATLRPDLAEELKNKLAELDRAAMEGATATGAEPNFNINRTHELNGELEELLDRIRASDSELEGYFLPPRASDLEFTLPDGTIVVINVSFKCDAIIVKDGEIRHVPLPYLNETDISQAVRCLEMIRMEPQSVQMLDVQRALSFRLLQWLWVTTVGPVLDSVGFVDTPQKGSKWPRVWWIPTGALSQLPLHAAGIHEAGSSATALDRVISSYSASIKALKYTQKNRASRPKGLVGDVVLAAMKTTKGLLPLDFANKEVHKLEGILSPAVPVEVLEQPSKADLVSRLKSCDVFHFAGHGKSNLADPYLSCICLHDWREDPLNVQTLVGMQLHKRAPWLAYLSACSTGESKNQDLHDEAIHLVSACQLAGFQHVVGSFWEVSDFYSVQAAEQVYGTIKDGIGTSDDVALGVHRAAQLLRGLATVDAAESRSAAEASTSIALEETEDDEGGFIHSVSVLSFKFLTLMIHLSVP